ncbi:hypothetical protein AB0G76_30900 [Streptomyces asoensis]|uniref:hypothetical protein n=1 Tax=Streptomyces TaxID=1883 RepID=UPI00190DE107|nr:hypothetical protein [Streptomyces sp. MBT49]MBK3623698.1 hypothetical protein [Streptomyces sp. MBT49]
MTWSSQERSRRIAAAASALIVITVVALVVLALEAGLPHAWWPHTGQAFTTGARPAGDERCARIVGPAKAYCERGATHTTASRPDVAGAAWKVASGAAGGAALLVWRLRCTAGQRRP